jgi:hypothetical protein
LSDDATIWTRTGLFGMVPWLISCTVAFVASPADSPLAGAGEAKLPLRSADKSTLCSNGSNSKVSPLELRARRAAKAARRRSDQSFIERLIRFMFFQTHPSIRLNNTARRQLMRLPPFFEAAREKDLRAITASPKLQAII